RGFSGERDVKFPADTYAKREYCVQYRESDFNFVSRLMEEEGIFYYFEHTQNGHALLLGNSKAMHKSPSTDSSVQYSAGAGIKATSTVTSWSPEHEFRPGKFAHTDYDFQNPELSLLSKASNMRREGGNDAFEIFDYPGEYRDKNEGDTLAKVRIGEIETGQVNVSGTSNCRGFTAGYKVKIENLPTPGDDTFILTEVQSSATTGSYSNDEDEGEETYSNSFTCIPADVTYRPKRVTPSPVMNGPQPAIVVGPQGEEIYVDKFGRVKVHFYWDRHADPATEHDKCSCWIRVSHLWAGKQFGALFHPRIGQEVIVDFYEGDPDQPIITGRVYNAVQVVPGALPGNMNLSGIATRSTKGGTLQNENVIVWDDTKGKEYLKIQAEKDLHGFVEHDEDWEIDHDQTITVKNDRTETVEGKEVVTITGDRTHKIKQGNDKKTIDQGNETIDISLGKSTKTAMQSIELIVGQNSIKIDQTGITLKGNIISVEAQAVYKEKAPIVQVNGDGMVMIKGGITMIN
ncbi:MAG TPA: type VI secretion system tip protein TssI/VgrG, partial [Terriglobales bacterium]|nr:type VI secretion system tip protein TssI/VgrG [Terriglobales bacterium]